MTNEEIIDGLKFTMEMCLYNPTDGSMRPVSTLNDMDKTTYDACEGAIKALEQTRWIPIKTRPMTEEEKEHFFEYADSRCDDTYTILDCPLPDDGQEVILSVNGYVSTDIFCRDSADGCYFESYDIDDVNAWMPLPQPYKAEREV